VIHQTAIVDENSKIADDVEIGPYTVIGADVEIGSGSRIGPHVVINGPTKIGKNNRIFQFASVGEDPQDLKFSGEKSYLEIGDNNTVREFVTISRGTADGGGATRIGNDNLLMAYVHIAHDCQIGNHIIFLILLPVPDMLKLVIMQYLVVLRWCTSFQKLVHIVLPVWAQLLIRMCRRILLLQVIMVRQVVLTRLA